MLLGRAPGAGGALVVVVPAGSGVRRHLWGHEGSGAVGRRRVGGSGPCTTVALSWNGKAVLGKEIGKEKGLRRVKEGRADI